MASFRLGGVQILSGRLSTPTVCDNVERDFLTLAKIVHARAFDRANMNEDIFVAGIRLNEAEAFLGVKPFYCSRVHGIFL
jgi:hypothetical protein